MRSGQVFDSIICRKYDENSRNDLQAYNESTDRNSKPNQQRNKPTDEQTTA